MIRRVVVAALLLLVIFVIVAATKALFGADEATSVDGVVATAGPQPTAGVAPVVTDAAPASAPAATDATTTSSSAVADGSRLPTAADPARLYIAGDSDAGAFGPFLENLVDDTGLVTTTLDYKTSSGLARPDFFDWPAHFQTQLGALNPDIVIVTFGGNDGQPIHGMNDQVDSDEWRAEYGSRVGAAMDLLSAGGRTLIWVGIPNGPTDDFTARLKVQNEVVTAEAAKRPDVVMIDTWSRFTGLDGGYAEYVIDPRDGVSKDVRAADGFHLNVAGAEILALDINAAVLADLVARGAQL